MYNVAVARDFIASHYLIGGDWGAENELHAHHYKIEIVLFGEELDEHGYLVDIVDIENTLDDLVSKYRDNTLNDLEEFNGLNPSIEHFSRILCEAFTSRLNSKNILIVELKIWENEIAWAGFRKKL
jgi:6-pyruvoyltetrahydropterin/6-carboxytetrahydropterin synthase